MRLTGMIEFTLNQVWKIGSDIVVEMTGSIEKSLLISEDWKIEWVVQTRNLEKIIATLLGAIGLQVDMPTKANDMFCELWLGFMGTSAAESQSRI